MAIQPLRAAMPLLILAAPLLADGGMFSKRTIESVGEAGAVVSGRQEAVLATDGNTVQVVLRTHYSRGPEELAWVVPVPARPSGIRTADPAIFDELEGLFAPRFYSIRQVRSHPGFGCASAPLAFETSPGMVVVHEAGTAGMYDYAVLSADDATVLRRWLDDHHYAIPASSDATLAHYVGEGWHWLCMRLHAERVSGQDVAPAPIAYSYKSDTPVFPLVISRTSAGEESEIILYVIGPARYAVSGWASLAIGQVPIQLDASSPSGTSYERQLSRLGRQRHFITEYAGPGVILPRTQAAASATTSGLRDPWTTRLRTIVSPEQMDRDLVLRPLAGGTPVDGTIYIDRPDSSPPISAELSAGAVLLLLMRRRRI